MAIGDMYELLDAQEYLGQDVINAYFYVNIGINEGAWDNLAAAFDFYVIPKLRAMQSPSLQHVGLAVRNLNDPLDFGLYTSGYPKAGLIATAGESPSFLAVSFMYKRASMAVRNGWKRIAGIADGSVSGNTWTDSAALLTDVATILGSDIDVGGGSIVFRPVIARRPVPPAITWQDFPIDGVVVKGVTTQNTRKPRSGS